MASEQWPSREDSGDERKRPRIDPPSGQVLFNLRPPSRTRQPYGFGHSVDRLTLECDWSARCGMWLWRYTDVKEGDYWCGCSNPYHDVDYEYTAGGPCKPQVSVPPVQPGQ